MYNNLWVADYWWPWTCSKSTLQLLTHPDFNKVTAKFYSHQIMKSKHWLTWLTRSQYTIYSKHVCLCTVTNNTDLWLSENYYWHLKEAWKCGNIYMLKILIFISKFIYFCYKIVILKHWNTKWFFRALAFFKRINVQKK